MRKEDLSELVASGFGLDVGDLLPSSELFAVVTVLVPVYEGEEVLVDAAFVYTDDVVLMVAHEPHLLSAAGTVEAYGPHKLKALAVLLLKGAFVTYVGVYGCGAGLKEIAEVEDELGAGA